MDVAGLFTRLKSLSLALRERNWVAVALVLADLAGPALEWLAQGEQARAEGREWVAAMAGPIDIDSLDSIADWCEAQCRHEGVTVSTTGASGTFPWPLVAQVVLALIARLRDRLATR